MAEAKKPGPKPKPKPESKPESKAGSAKQWYEDQLKKVKESDKKKDWIVLGSIVVVIIIVVIVASVVATGGDGDSGVVAEKETSATVASETETSATVAPETATSETEVAGSTGVMLETISDGTYLVGKDIPAGVYKGEVTGGGAYYQISSDANGLDIIARENVTAQFYLEVEDGQFLKLFNVKISQ